MKFGENYFVNSLVEKGFLFESGSLTPVGRIYSEELLMNPEFLREYFKMAKIEYSKYPVNQRKILWKNLLRNLKKIQERERNLNVSFVKE